MIPIITFTITKLLLILLLFLKFCLTGNHFHPNSPNGEESIVSFLGDQEDLLSNASADFFAGDHLIQFFSHLICSSCAMNN